MAFEIRRSTAAETFPLRRQVLRPHDRTDELSDRDSDIQHFAVWADGEVVGSAAVRRQTPPAGFTTRGEPWQEPLIGPHIAMELSVDSGGA